MWLGVARVEKVDIRRFCDDERGGITILMIAMFTMLMLSTGMALDLMRHETERAELQSALDRGVLAAANLNQTETAQDVVNGFVSDRILSDYSVTPNVVDTPSINSRRVTGTASYMQDTVFLRLVGIPQLRVAATSTALHGRDNVEISMVLDISGTMRWGTGNSTVEDNRISRLRPAARAFVTGVLADGADATTTISIVPYAGGVNPGEWMFNRIGGTETYHSLSHCPELADADFPFQVPVADTDPEDYPWVNTGLPEGISYDQVPNFHYWAIDWNWMDWGWCPSADSAITYLSNSEEGLHSAIDRIRLHDGTGTYNAMKWGLALLDPASQPIIEEMTAPEVAIVDAAFSDRPAPWDEADTLKVIILMTDGQITEQNRPSNPSDPALNTEEVLVYDHPRERTITRSTGLGWFYDICEASKQKGVVVFTIAFAAPTSAQNEMRECARLAGTVSNFYIANLLSIDDVFEQIRSTIGALRLVE